MEADLLAMHALVISVALGASFSVIMLLFGGRSIVRRGRRWRTRRRSQLLQRRLRGQRVALGHERLGQRCSRHRQYVGTGIDRLHRRGRSGTIVASADLRHRSVSGARHRRGCVALVLYYAAGTAVLGWYVLSGRNIARLRMSRLHWPLFRSILGVGAVASVTSLQTNVIITLVTALVATTAGLGASAGYGTGARLEYLLIPIIFGLGAPLVALVGTNIGAGHRERALRIAFVGAAIAFAITEAIGIAAAIWPRLWITQFSADPRVVETGTAYLRLVGPAYEFFGLGLALYFASQGAGRLFWPLSAGFLRMLVAIAAGWLALYLTGSLQWLFAAVAVGLFLHGSVLLVAIASGAWFRDPHRQPVSSSP